MDAKAIKELEKLDPHFCHKHGFAKPCGGCIHFATCLCCQSHEQTRVELAEYIKAEEKMYDTSNDWTE